MFEKIKKYYELGLWSEAMVRNAVEKGVITEDEFNLIVSQATE